MAGLLIKNIPPELHEDLKRRAAANHRSLTKEALAILEAALREEAERPTLAQLDRHRIRGAKRLTDAVVRRGKTLGRP
jgi:plasmid stability protein